MFQHVCMTLMDLIMMYYQVHALIPVECDVHLLWKPIENGKWNCRVHIITEKVDLSKVV